MDVVEDLFEGAVETAKSMADAGTADDSIFEVALDEDHNHKARAPPDGKHEPTTTNATTVDAYSVSVCLTFQHLTVTTRPRRQDAKKQLLNGICGTIWGGLWAVMGASGSGKTTFLSSLSLRLDTYRMQQSGLLYLNGRPYDKSKLKSVSGFVMQDDLVNAHLTVFETLRYAAELRMPASTPRQERLDMIESVMGLVGIVHCRDTIVGDTRTKGVSGGERKRLCIAIELLTKPRLLFLDEPTSGLDSATAFSVVKLLKTLSSAARFPTTVIATLHQPQSKIFDLFDNLILMRKGDIVYQGAAGKSVVGYFDSLGYTCPQYTNPADHLLDVLTAPAPAAAAESPPFPLPVFVGEVDQRAGSDQPAVKRHKFLPWPRQFYILFLRSLHLHIRRYDIILMNVFVTMLVSTFVSMSTWRSLGTSNSSTSRRLPALFYCVIHQGIISSLQGSHSFPLDRALMLRERSAGTYSVSAYFAAKSTADFATQVISPIVFSCMVYPIVGFDPGPGGMKFFIFLIFMILTSQASTSLSNLVSCVCVSIELSTVVLACCYEITRLYGGWFIKPADMAAYPEWRFADVLSYIKYSFIGISINENSGLAIHCVGPPNTCAAPCKLTEVCTGAAIDKFYGYDAYTVGGCAGVLLLYIIVCKILSYLALRYIKM